MKDGKKGKIIATKMAAKNFISKNFLLVRQSYMTIPPQKTPNEKPKHKSGNEYAAVLCK